MRAITDLRIGTRLGAAFGVLLLVITIIGTVGYVASDRMHGEVRTIYEDRTIPLADLGRIDYLLQRNRVLVMDMLIRNTPDVVQRRAAELRNNKAEMDRIWQKYMATYLTPQERTLAEGFAQARQTYETEGLAPAAAALEAGDAARALALYEGKVSPLAPTTAEAMRKLVQLQVEVAAQEYADTDRLDTAINLVMVIGTGLTLLLGVGLAVVITRSITQPIRRAVEVAQTVAAGDLGSRIDAVGRDETADLLRALKTMNDSLVRIVGEVRQASDAIATGSSQIASGNADLSQRTEEQASNLEETAASMEELTATVRQNAETARQASQIARGASEAASRGGEVVGQVVTTMQDITTSSQKIADIIGVIDGIAFQTNILALNAAVEAGRAPARPGAALPSWRARSARWPSAAPRRRARSRP